MNANIDTQLNAMLANRNAINEAINLRAGETLINADAGLTDAPEAILSIPTDSNTLYYKTDDASAYEKLVPRGAQPMTQLISVGGMTRVDKSPNLLPFMATGQYYITAPPNWYNFVDVTIPAGTYRITYNLTQDGEDAAGDSSFVNAYYGSYVDSSDSVEVKSGDVFTITEEKFFYFQAICFSDAGNSYDYLIRDAMLYAVPDESEKHIKPFVKYYEHLVPTPVTEIVSEGKNILPDTVYDINNWQEQESGSINKVFNLEIPKEGLYVISAQELTHEHCYLYLEKSTDGITYTNTNSSYSGTGYLENGYFITNNGIFPRYFEHKEGYKWRLWLYGANQEYLDAVKGIQIEYVAPDASKPPFPSPTKYAPYHAEPLDTIAIPEVVKSDAMWGYGVKGKKAVTGTYDIVEAYNTYDYNTREYTKRVSDIITLDGSKVKFTWYSSSGQLTFSLPGLGLPAPIVAPNGSTALISSHFNPAMWGTNDYDCWLTSDSFICRLPSNITSFNEANEWLKEQAANDNPVTIQYALAEPIVTTIDDDSYTPPKFIRTEAGGTITFENEAKEAVPSSVKYLIDLGEIE